MFETSCIYIYILLDRGRREKKKKETPSFGLHSLDLHNSQALRKIETINGESSVIMKTTPGSRYPLFHNHNKYYTPPPPLLPCWKACSSRRTPRAASSRTGRAISLSLSLSLLFREKKSSRGRAVTAVIGNQGRVRVDRGQTRPSMKPLSTLRALSRQSRPLDSIIDRLNSLFTHRINPPIESRSVYYNNNIRASNRFELRDNSSLVMTARSGNCFQTTVRSNWMETRFRSKKILNVIIQTCVYVCAW